MKSQVAASAVAIASLAREGFEPSGDLIFAATADEEVGEDFGLSWLCREHPDAVRADYCVNEGGGDRVEVDGKTIYLCSTAEKMSSPFLLRVHGRSGHASMPGIADNALVKAARYIECLGALSPTPRLLPQTEAFFAALGDVPKVEELPARLAVLEPGVRGIVEPMLWALAPPTMVEASNAKRHPGALRDRLRLPPASGAKPGGGRARREGVPRRRPRLRDRMGRGSRRHVLAAHRTTLGGGAVVRGRGGSRRYRRPSRAARIHRQPFHARGVRHDCVRLLPDEGDGFRARRSADPLRGRAGRVDDLELGTRFLRHVARTLEP